MSKNEYIDFDQTKASLDFSRVLEFYNIKSSGSGKQRKISCPFHSPDKNPSCGVNLTKKAFQCFSCKAKGNILAFVAMKENLDPGNVHDLKAAAVFALKEIMHLDPADFSGGSSRDRKRPRLADASMNSAARQTPRSSRRMARQADASEESQPKVRRNEPLELKLTLDTDHHFFSDHGISRETVAAFGLGYCSRGLMKGRIAIPIHSSDGELVAYAGRWADEDPPPGTERYRLPKNFHKSFELFNLHRAVGIGGRHLILVEGYWSAMRLHLLGLPCVASFGSSVSPEQATLIRTAGFRFVTVLFDGDEGGRSGIDQALPVLGRQVYARALELPEGEKPDSLPEAFFNALRSSQKS